MNINMLSVRALRYLSSLKSPLPCESDTEFYEQNREDYNSLLILNKKGLGATEKELFQLAIPASPLCDVYVITHSFRSDKHTDEFIKEVHSVWSAEGDARGELERIKEGYAGEEAHLKDWKAHSPNGRGDELSLDLFDGRWYNCQSFYSISPIPVQSRATYSKDQV